MGETSKGKPLSVTTIAVLLNSKQPRQCKGCVLLKQLPPVAWFIKISARHPIVSSTTQ